MEVLAFLEEGLGIGRHMGPERILALLSLSECMAQGLGSPDGHGDPELRHGVERPLALTLHGAVLQEYFLAQALGQMLVQQFHCAQEIGLMAF